MALSEKQLGQSRPANTNAASIYSPSGSSVGIVKNINVCNTTTAPATFRIFVDKDGTTYDQTTALFYDCTVEANSTVSITSYIIVDNGGNLAVRSSIASALTFTVSGAEYTA